MTTMKREEILNMPAGREMDALIAEKVMGWHKGKYHFYDGTSINEVVSDWLDSEGHYKCGIGTEDGFEDNEDFHLLRWHPSESILWAWEVVEKLSVKGVQFYICTNFSQM